VHCCAGDAGHDPSAADPPPQQHLLRANVDGVRVAVDFETLFLALGLANWGAQQVEKELGL